MMISFSSTLAAARPNQSSTPSTCAGQIRNTAQASMKRRRVRRSPAIEMRLASGSLPVWYPHDFLRFLTCGCYRAGEIAWS